MRSPLPAAACACRIRCAPPRRRLGAALGLFAAALLATQARAQSADDGFDPNVNNAVSAIAVDADGRLLIGGAFTTVGVTTTRHRIARLAVDGSVDPTFDPDADSSVSAIALQGDGAILIGGAFTTLHAGTIARNHLARLGANGNVDMAFDAGANGSIGAIAVQEDGRVLIGGTFTTLKGGAIARNRIARLNSDGSVDLSFDPDANGGVTAIAVQADGRIVVGGSFTTLAGGSSTRRRLARLEKTGQVDSAFDPDADNVVYAIGVEADGGIVFGGAFTHLANGAVTRNHVARVDGGGVIDPAFNPDADNNVLQIAVQADDATLLAGNFTHLGGGVYVRNHVARLSPGGTVDTTFDPDASANVFALAVQPDDKIVLGGIFTALDGGAVARNRLARLYPDGGIDRTLNPNANADVYALASQVDGKVLLGGAFTTLAGGATPRNRLARLFPDGAIDTFDPNLGGFVAAISVESGGTILVAGGFTTVGAGNIAHRYVARLKENGGLLSGFDPDPDSFVECIATQPDGRILIGGNFLTLKNGTSMHPLLARVASDGSVDEGFNPNPDSEVATIAVQPDGRIVIGGYFQSLRDHAVVRTALARLEADGSVDETFDPEPDGIVRAVALQPDGSILVGGEFTSLNNGAVARRYLARLDANGSVDESFDPDPDLPVRSLALDTEGRIVVAGDFTHLNHGAVSRNHVARVDGSGTVDPAFDPDADSAVEAVAIADDGKVLLGGVFTTLGGGAATRHHIARIGTSEAALQALVLGPGEVTWYRYGASPELIAAPVVGFSTSGAFFPTSATMEPIMGGWRSSGLAFPAGERAYVRVLGMTGSGLQNGSQGALASVRAFFLADDIFGSGFE